MKKYLFLFFSFFIFSFMFVSAVGPQLDFTMRVASVNNTSANVYLSGWATSTLGTGESYKIIRKWESRTITMNIGTASGKLDINVPLQDIEYELQRIDGRGTVLENKKKNIKLTPKPDSIVQGIGWGASNDKGIGWISVSSETQESGARGPHSPSVPYGVFADTDGQMHGVMWAGHQSAGKVGYGWLSFNEDDLKNCPSGGGRSCDARISGNGQVSGWARFINADGNSSSWDGFVQLRGTTGNGKTFGLCLGDAAGDEVKINGVKIYSGETCNTTPGNNKLSGLAWAGNTVGGWIVFSGSSGGVGFSSTTTPLVVIPAGKQNIAIREHRKFQANHDVAWFVDGTIGGNSTYGIIDRNTPKNTDATYVAPRLIPDPDATILKASSTDDSTTPPGIETRDIKILPPYSLACFKQGSTAIQLVVTKNYSDPNYSNDNRHLMNLYGDRNTNPTTIISSQFNGQLTSFLHTGLLSDVSYFYKLETKYDSDGYSHFTNIIECSTGVGTPTSGAPANLNAYAYDKNTVVVNWKDNSKRTDPYDFQLQRIKVTPNKDIPLSVSASGTAAMLQWQNKTVSTPYLQEVWRKVGNGNFMKLYDGVDISWTSTSTPPTGPVTYTFLDTGVSAGTTYTYKITACSSIDLTGLYSTPIAGGSGKPTRVCVDSSLVSYVPPVTNRNNFIGNFTASIFRGVQGIFDNVFNETFLIFKKSKNVIQNTSKKISSIFYQDDSAKAAGSSSTPFNYYAYFQDYAITTNPAFKDTGLDADTVYLYRVAISDISTSTQIWSNLRAVKTLKDFGLGKLSNVHRSICMRNSFCDGSFEAWTNGPESSEQQCQINKHCVDVGRSDQGFEEQ